MRVNQIEKQINESAKYLSLYAILNVIEVYIELIISNRKKFNIASNLF